MFTLLTFYTGCMKKLDKRILDSQIEVFCEWGRRHAGYGGNFGRSYLELFAIHTSKTDILDVTQEDVEIFINSEHLPYPHQKERARSVIGQMRRFYVARVRNGRQRLVGGRPPAISAIGEVQRLRNMKDEKGNKLSFRNIAKIMGKQLSLVHRWSKYPLPKRGDERDY